MSLEGLVNVVRGLGTNFILFLVLSSVGCSITRFPSALETLGRKEGGRVTDPCQKLSLTPCPDSGLS